MPTITEAQAEKTINYGFMNRYTENLDVKIRAFVARMIDESEPDYDIYSQTLLAGDTSVTFEVPIGDFIVEVLTDKDGLGYIDIDDSIQGFITVTFPVQTDDVAVFLRLEPIPSGSQMLSQVLRAGDTSVTFTNIPLTDNIIEVYTSMEGLNYTDIDDSVLGQITITYEPQAVDVTIYLSISGTTPD